MKLLANYTIKADKEKENSLEANDDLLAFEHTSTGTPANSSVKWAYVFSAPAITAPVTGYYRLPMMGPG